MIFQHPKRDIGIIIVVFILIFIGLLCIPFITRLIHAQYARAAKGVVEVQLSPDERKGVEKEIVEIHNAIQKGDRGGEATIAKQYIHLGELYERLGYLLKAQDAYARALKQDERDTSAKIHLAKILGRMGDHDGAKKAFDEAIALDPMRWEQYKAFADYYMTMRNDAEEARGAYLNGLIATSNNKDLIRAYVVFLDSIGAQSESAAYRQVLGK